MRPIIPIIFLISFVVTVDRYKYIHYDDIVNLMTSLQSSSNYNQIFKIYDGFEHHKISSIPKCGNTDCLNPIFEVSSFYKGAEYVSTLPVVLLIGGMHGDEVIGSNTYYYLLKYFDSEFMRKDSVKVLLESVRFIILPASNPNGFFNHNRIEDNLGQTYDVNRDFPYDSKECFQTASARLINQVFLKNLVVGCLTFHGGDNSISYPWGNKPHSKHTACEDNTAFVSVAHVLKTVSGENASYEMASFKTGTMTDTVYSVRGGFEDYAYGGSLDPQFVNKQCEYIDHANQKIIIQNNFEDSSLRAFIFLIEASSDKTPDEKTLGPIQATENNDYLSSDWGYINRSIFMVLRFAQVIKNYLVFSSLSWEDGFVFKMKVYGCITIDEVSSSEGSLEDVSSQYNQRSNVWTLIRKLKTDKTFIPEIKFEIKCDKNFQADKNAQSHFLRLKTGLVKEIKLKESNLSSFENLTAKLSNIQKDLLDKAIIKWNGFNQQSLFYNLELFISDEIILSFENGKLKASMVLSEKVEIYETDSFDSQKARIPILQILKNQPVFISQQQFLELAGKNVEVFMSGDSQEATYKSIIKVKGDQFTGMHIPENGLVGRILIDIKPRMLVLAKWDLNSSLQVRIISPNLSIRSFSPVGEFENPDFTENVHRLPSGLYVVERVYKVTSMKDLFLLGRSFEIVDNLGNSHSFIFGRRDKTEKESFMVLSFFETLGDFNPVWVPLLIFGLLFVFLGASLFFLRKSKNVLSEPLDNIVNTIQIIG